MREPPGISGPQNDKHEPTIGSINPFDALGDVIKDALDLVRDLINDAPIHGDWWPLKPCSWVKLGEIRDGETGVVQLEPADNTLERDLAGKVEVGGKRDDPEADDISSGHRIVGPAKVYIHLKLPEGDHVHGCKVRLNVYPPKEARK